MKPGWFVFIYGIVLLLVHVDGRSVQKDCLTMLPESRVVQRFIVTCSSVPFRFRSSTGDIDGIVKLGLQPDLQCVKDKGKKVSVWIDDCRAITFAIFTEEGRTYRQIVSAVRSSEGQKTFAIPADPTLRIIKGTIIVNSGNKTIHVRHNCPITAFQSRPWDIEIEQSLTECPIQVSYVRPSAGYGDSFFSNSYNWQFTLMLVVSFFTILIFVINASCGHFFTPIGIIVPIEDFSSYRIRSAVVVCPGRNSGKINLRSRVSGKSSKKGRKALKKGENGSKKARQSSKKRSQSSRMSEKSTTGKSSRQNSQRSARLTRQSSIRESSD
ncbi:unnamed protein product [Bursaphelenchus okinawaensis]|uniref:ZP domain-containing protein n=1 Tax=Bursaphelenchus okinawaensis TaxID=465554 RepID=A0A811KV41_9BILA|nr:unnamed protein product [Bursaphelenchus okinawaensis]CAG9113796.1 unnamed protein product [Bursaphelenchus okinawaensis]